MNLVRSLKKVGNITELVNEIISYRLVEALAYLYEVLVNNGNDAVFRELSLSHSRASCNENMNEYLMFYSGVHEK